MTCQLSWLIALWTATQSKTIPLIKDLDWPPTWVEFGLTFWTQLTKGLCLAHSLYTWHLLGSLDQVTPHGHGVVYLRILWLNLDSYSTFLVITWLMSQWQFVKKKRKRMRRRRWCILWLYLDLYSTFLVITWLMSQWQLVKKRRKMMRRRRMIILFSFIVLFDLSFLIFFLLSILKRYINDGIIVECLENSMCQIIICKSLIPSHFHDRIIIVLSFFMLLGLHHHNWT